MIFILILRMVAEIWFTAWTKKTEHPFITLLVKGVYRFVDFDELPVRRRAYLLISSFFPRVEC